MKAGQRDKYQVPEGLIKYLCQDEVPTPRMVRLVHKMRGMQLRVEEEEEEAEWTEGELSELAEVIQNQQSEDAFVRSVVISSKKNMEEGVELLRKKLLADYDKVVFAKQTSGSPPVRGPFGEAEIVPKPGAVPVKQRMFQFQGERRQAWVDLSEALIKQGKWE